MGNRGSAFETANEIVGQYSFIGPSSSKAKIVSFFRELNKTGGVRDENGSPRISRQAFESAGNLADELAEKVVVRDTQAEQDYKAIRKMLNGSYRISDQDRSNIPDFSAYVRSRANFVKINKTGYSLDSKYQELAQMYPHYFNADTVTNPADQLQDINRALGQLKNSSIPLTDSDRSEVSYEITNDLLKLYYYNIVRKRA